MPVVSTTKMNARQFEMLGEDPPGVRLELVNGEVAVSPSLRPRHSRVGARLTRILLNHIIDHDLGELLGDLDTVLGEHDVRRPDLAYFAKERVGLIRPDSAVESPPDLCIEIISPSSGTIDRTDKFRQYAKAGVPHYWIVDPLARSFEGFRSSSGRYRPCGGGSGAAVIKLEPFPDLEISLGELWLPEAG